MKPTMEQLSCALSGFEILKEHMICYLAMEERTGKTLTSILIAEICENTNSVLIVTKKKALPDWEKTLKQFKHNKKYTVTNYHQVHKYGRHDLLILDEAHNYIAGCPKQSAINKSIASISVGIPIIYLSATPHAQGYQMMYHQLFLSSWSPWRRYKDFYAWFKVYGIPQTIWVNQKQRPVYTNTKEELIKKDIEPFMFAKTRKELGFEHEPTDKVHYLELSQATKDIYNKLIKDKYLEFSNYELVCDTTSKLRFSLHMLEGGVAKIEEEYLILRNCEKINYILKHWGDSEDIVIYYQYIAEGRKLRAKFSKATILQGTSYAEGIDLAHKKTIIVYSQDCSTARHTQRRARQAARHRDEPIVVHYLLVKGAVSEQIYNCVAVNKRNFVDSVFVEYTI